MFIIFNLLISFNTYSRYQVLSLPCSSMLKPVFASQLLRTKCASLPNSAFNVVMLVTWNGPQWVYLHYRNQQMLQVRALSLYQSASCSTFTTTPRFHVLLNFFVPQTTQYCAFYLLIQQIFIKSQLCGQANGPSSWDCNSE